MCAFVVTFTAATCAALIYCVTGTWAAVSGRAAVISAAVPQLEALGPARQDMTGPGPTSSNGATTLCVQAAVRLHEPLVARESQANRREQDQDTGASDVRGESRML